MNRECARMIPVEHTILLSSVCLVYELITLLQMVQRIIILFLVAGPALI